MKSTGTRVIIALIVLAAFGGFGAYVHGHQAKIERPADYSLIPMETDGYFGGEHRFAEYTYEILRADTTTLRMYTDRETGDIFWLFIAYFESQKYGSQIHSPIHCVPGGGYQILAIEPYTISLRDGRSLNVRRLLIGSQRRKEVMFYWFETRSGVIANEYGLKFDLMKNSLLLMPTDAAICRVTFPLLVSDDFEEASARAEEFIRDFYGDIEKALPFSGS